MDENTEHEVMRFKWLADGCETWEAVIERLEEMKKEIQRLKKQGYVIDSSSDDYLFYYKPEMRKKRKVKTKESPS